MSKVTLKSFGFKYGIPPANYYFDVGFVKNPAREKNWSFFKIPDEEMRKFVLDQQCVKDFLNKVIPLIEFLSTIDQNQVFAFGCSAGRHRSTTIVRDISDRLNEIGIETHVEHRDLD